jgi:hypothetical protein
MNTSEFTTKLIEYKQCGSSMEDCDRADEIHVELVEAFDSLAKLVGSDVLWPLATRTAAEAVFGGGIHNPRGRVHKSLDRRIQHALRVWRSRYGLNGPQLVYAGDVLAWAIRRGAEGLADDDQRRYPFVLKQLERIVNADEVHQGMKRRSEYTVDVSTQLKELVAEATATPFDD